MSSPAISNRAISNRAVGNPAVSNPAATAPASSRPVWLAAIYVAAWLAGLAVLPSGPDAQAAPAEITAGLTASAGRAIAQSWLVHGIAGVALLALALSVSHRVKAANAWGRAAAFGAAATSLAQVVFLHLAVFTAVFTADPPRPGRAAGWAHAVNLADTVKLALLGLLVGWLSRAVARSLGRATWFARAGVALAVLLPLGGLSFLTPQPALSALLVVSLPLLLAWSVTVALLAGRAGDPAVLAGRAGDPAVLAGRAGDPAVLAGRAGTSMPR